MKSYYIVNIILAVASLTTHGSAVASRALVIYTCTCARTQLLCEAARFGAARLTGAHMHAPVQSCKALRAAHTFPGSRPEIKEGS